MDLIEMTRKLCRSLQKDERFIQMQIAKTNVENDEMLNTMINEFNLKKLEVNEETSKDNIDSEKIQRLNDEMRQCYEGVLGNENMIALNEKKQKLNKLIREMTSIIIRSAEAEDPDKIDIDDISCTHDCGSCAGCS